MSQVIDYRNKVSDFSKIFSFKQQGIDKREKPDFIPFISERFFNSSGCRVVFLKNAENDYLLYSDNETAYRVNLDILALTQDYYLKLAKEKQRLENERTKALYIEKYGEEKGKRIFTAKRISVMKDNKMTHFQMKLFRDCFYDTTSAWKAFHENLSELNQKLEDMELESLDNENTHTKGELTSYGDSNLSSALLNQYGVKIKRQNGEAVTFNEAEKIQNSLDEIFKVFGDLSPVFRQYGLKISFAGDKRMHARKAIGIFYNVYKAIGTSENDMTQTLSHEIAHFMDFYATQSRQIKRAHASDEEGSLERKISKIFRQNMNKKQHTAYQNRSCECFARAFEQYFNPLKGEVENYCKPEIFENELKPLIKTFLDEFNKIVESVRAEQPEDIKRTVKEETEEKAAASVPLNTQTVKPEQLTLF